MQRPSGRGSAGNTPDFFDRLRDCGKLLTVKEFADILAISQKTIYSYVSRNMIPYIKIESSVRFRPKHIASWISQRDSYVPD